MFNHHVSYSGYLQDLPDAYRFYMGPEYEAIYGTPFWFAFIVEAERRLARAGVRPRGCADGDLPLPGCKYASLRNEAFVRVPQPVVDFRDPPGDAGEAPEMQLSLAYPPNALGWNAAGHFNPFLDLLFFLKVRAELQQGRDAVMVAGRGDAEQSATPTAVESERGSS
jgi:hypothetical protein